MVSELTSIGRQTVPPPVKTPSVSRVEVKEVASSQAPVSAKGMDVAASGNGQPAVQESGSAASREDVMEAVHKMRDYMQIIDRDLHFNVDEDSGITVVKVIDPATEEVVRQIPSEEVMRVVRSLERGGGLLSDIKA